MQSNPIIVAERLPLEPITLPISFSTFMKLTAPVEVLAELLVLAPFGLSVDIVVPTPPP